MMTNPIYTVEKITSDGVQVRYENGSWAVLPVTAEMEAADVDDLAAKYAPKDYAAPSFVSIGTQRTATEKPEPVYEEPEREEVPEWLQKRVEAYGLWTNQLEFITENGLEAWQKKVADIKTANPKT